MSENQKKQSKTKSNPILWFLFAIIVPLIVAITIIIIIFTVAGFNVMGWAKSTVNHIPVVSSVVKTDKEKSEQRTEETFTGEIVKKDKKIDELTTNVTDLETTIDQLKQDIIKLENAEKTTNTIKDKADDKSEKKEKNSSLKSMIESFEVIDPEQSALILQDLEEETVIKILQRLPGEVRAEIFEELDPKKAAQYTKAYLDSGE